VHIPRAPIAALGIVLLVGGSPTAADRPIEGDRLRLTDPPASASRRQVVFRTTREPAIAPNLANDPRTLGAVLEIAGAGPGDGATGPLTLPPHLWTGLGNPPGSTGFRYADRAARTGIRKVLFKRGSRGGALVVTGGGRHWPFAITRAQGPIDVRFAVGDDLYCARFTRFARNGPGRVIARAAAAPERCREAPTQTCGNGVREGTEQCDDGNTTGGDGCSSTCGVEAICGDGTVEGGEECDDGNRTDGDGCSSVCRVELCAGVATASGERLAVELVAAGLEMPVHVAAPPLDLDRLFVVEQAGRIRIIKDGVLLAAPFLSMPPGTVSCCGERGLLSIAFHPRFARTGRFFVYYTDMQGDLVIARYQVGPDPDDADESSEVILLTIGHRRFGNHNGGQLAFGPDGYLYAGTGDGGGGGDPDENALDGGSLLGKLLRLDVDVEVGPPFYRVPPTNPFVAPGAPLDEIWAIGLRNPWRFSFDRTTADLYIADVGQDRFEEIDVQPGTSAGGESYGWDLFEGFRCFEGPCPDPPVGLTMPVLEYDHDAGCSVTGGFVYRGCRMPDLHGTYFYSDFCSSFVRTFRGVAGGVAQDLRDRTAELAPGGSRTLDAVSSFGEDARGELYIADHKDGEIFRIVPGS
jgi:hypothetical protein